VSVYVLDTDIWTLGWENHVPTRARITARSASDQVLVSAVTVEEVVTGWLASIRKAKTPDRLEFAFDKLLEAVRSLASFELVSFTRPAIDEFRQLVSLKLNVRHNDLRIAAIALSAGAVVVTRNLRDFRRVPGLACEDWSA